MEKLKQVLAQEDTVLFIGSGISMWSGLPSWFGLIEELAQFIESNGANADFIRAEAQTGDLLQAASYGFHKLTKPQIGDFIKAACRYGVAKPHEEIHRKIVSLGPRCFVTTNYDNLIEESLRKWQPDRFFRSGITNRHLTETADIVHARAIDFIFKPHGDAGDSESIVLTREQYRQLLPGGERQAALESLKMLLASRPVVYLGFGLRDPDFIYVRDLLAITYKGGTRDHYAIMADVTNAESDYWRQSYGIHLVSYPTVEKLDKTKDHTALLALLDKLLEKKPVIPKAIKFDPRTSDVILALTRHAAGLARSQKLDTEFQIRVHSEGEKLRRNIVYHKRDKFDYYPVDKFLDEGPERSVLIGLPGAGKTYALSRTAARLADKLHEACLAEPFDEKVAIVPILVDLKLYRGNLCDLVSQKLPKSLPIDELTSCFKVKIFLDSFNEMPREFWETGSYESDFMQFINRIGDSSLVIGSRTTDGLDKLGFPTYSLDLIDEETVTVELKRLGIEIEGRFSREVGWLLQRPFYFQYVLNGAVSLSKEAHPRDFYHSFFENLRKAFTARFNKQFDIEKVLSLVAYDALNRGEEAFPLSELLRVVKASLETKNFTDVDARDVANWLVSSSVLIPHTGGRVAFVHQSVTEYLAATELALRYQSSPYILKEKLSLTRWDQALFLTLSILPSEHAQSFLQDVINADFTLALKAIKYLEVGRDEVITKLLTEINEGRQSLDNDFSMTWYLRNLPFTEAHETLLRHLIEFRNTLGAAAVEAIVDLKGEDVKDELLHLLIEYPDDFNFCVNGIATALKPFAKNEDAQKIAEWANTIQDTFTQNDFDDDTIHGFISGAAKYLGEIDLYTIKNAFLPPDQTLIVPKVNAEILNQILYEHNTTEALEIAGELLLRGVNEAATSIYFIAEFAKAETKLSWDSFSVAHIEQLLSILDDPNDDSWSVNALVFLCAGRPDLAEIIKQKASRRSGIIKAALLYCISPDDYNPIFQALHELTKMSTSEIQDQNVRILKQIDINWEGKEELLVQLLKLRDVELATAITDAITDSLRLTSTTNRQHIENLEIGPIDWWLEWIMETDPTGEGGWLCYRLSELFAEHLNRSVIDKFVAEFNKSDSKYRRTLLHFLLPYHGDITTEVFSEDAISFMLADLSQKEKEFSFHRHLLSQTATEQFIIERLLPLLPDAKEPLLGNLRKVLKQAGVRHGKRYILG